MNNGCLPPHLICISTDYGFIKLYRPTYCSEHSVRVHAVTLFSKLRLIPITFIYYKMSSFRLFLSLLLFFIPLYNSICRSVVLSIIFKCLIHYVFYAFVKLTTFVRTQMYTSTYFLNIFFKSSRISVVHKFNCHPFTSCLTTVL